MSKQALDAKRLTAFAMDPNNLIIIGLDTKDDARHPLYDERIKLPLAETMVLNVAHNGVIEPVIVRKNGDRVEVVDGRQRVRAAREANKRLKKEGAALIEVPVVVRRGDDGGMLGVMISANENRVDDGVPVKLQKLQRFMALGKNEKDASIAFGVELQTIKGWLALLEAGPEVKQALASKTLSQSAAIRIAKLPREQQSEAVTAATANGPATVEEARIAANRVAVKTRSERAEKADGDSDGENEKKTTKTDKRGENRLLLKPPSKREIHRLLKSGVQLDPMVRYTIEWMMGLGGPERVMGLRTALEAARKTSDDQPTARSA